jgi:hypothetical protein
MSMKKAEVNGKLAVAGLDTPDTGVCLDCGTEVQKQRLRRMDGGAAYFYRHRHGLRN